MKTRLLLLAAGFSMAVLAARSLPAAEPFVAFLRALQNKGFGEQALAYLDQIAERPDLPADLKRDLNLERSKSYRIAAGEAYNDEQRVKRLAEAKRLSEEFFKANPGHSDAASTLLDEAKDALYRGRLALLQMQASRDAAEQKQLRETSRTALVEAKTLFSNAETTLKARLDALPPDKAPVRGRPSQRDAVEWSYLEARFCQAQASLFAAQTIDNTKDKDRVQWLKEAGDGFDRLFQEKRATPLAADVGARSHMWYGTVLEEQGNTQTAMDVYDEVLVLAPEVKDAQVEDAAIFGQAAYLRLKLLAKTLDPKKVIDEADVWLQTYKRWQPTGPYQGMLLETAKAQLKLAETAKTPAEKSKYTRDASATLTAIGKVESEHRHAAVMLKRGIVENTAAAANMTVSERIAVGDDAAVGGNLTTAEQMYRDAILQATNARDNKQLAAAKTRLAAVLYQRLLKHYSAAEMDEVLKVAGEIVKDNVDQPVAENASAVAVAAAMQLYAGASGEAKKTALDRLERVATFAIAKWPDKQVGDDARMGLAQARLMQGDYSSVEKLVAEVTPQSKRYATAMQILGQIRWKQYLDIKKSEQAADKADEMQKLRQEATTALETSVQRHRAGWQEGTEPMPEAMFDTQLMLAEILLEGQKIKESAVLFAPLVKALAEKPPGAIDLRIQRTYVGGVRALLAAGDAKQAGDAALAFAGITGDAAQPNSLLIDLSKLFAIELRKLEAEGAGAADGTPDSNIKDLKKSLGDQLDTISGRNLLTVPQLIYVGDTLALLNLTEKARAVYQRLLDMIDKDEAAKATAGAAVTRIRSRFISLLRAEGQLQQANNQIDALIKSHPTALEPLMEKGEILERLAESDPAKLDECIAHWTKLRVQLGAAKTRLPEYYDAIYNTARCLVKQSRKLTNKDKAAQAEQILRATLTLTPKLSGPDMVAKYQALLNICAKLRGVAPTPTPGSTATPAPANTPPANTPPATNTAPPPNGK